jgi:hypothetical protein
MRLTEQEFLNLKNKSGMNPANKFHAKITEIDNIKFASKREARRYAELKALRHAGEVKFFLMQVPFLLPAGLKYRLDFLVFWTNGNITFEDVKGFKNQVYIMKKKMVEFLYPIKIIEI